MIFDWWKVWLKQNRCIIITTNVDFMKSSKLTPKREKNLKIDIREKIIQHRKCNTGRWWCYL